MRRWVKVTGQAVLISSACMIFPIVGRLTGDGREPLDWSDALLWVLVFGVFFAARWWAEQQKASEDKREGP